ncbi:MAG: S-adenosyl-L-methionine-dependent methyltransferase [Monoraphidium minutum]|nr:MAG: S-adenosyl-L-methionine-dependent methyltransferase [Monoraphidium minutum]
MATLEEKNREVFDAQAASYDGKPHLVKMAAAVAARICETVDVGGKMCLDVGCGTGLVSQHVAAAARMTYGVDVSPAMAAAYNAKAAADEQLRGRMAAAVVSLFDPAAVAAAAAEGRLPAPGTVEVAWSSMVLHHLHDCAAFAAAVAPFLAPGGKLLLFDLLKTPGFNIMHLTPPSAADAAARHSVGHPEGFLEADVAALLAAAGLRLAAFEARAVSYEPQILVDGRAQPGAFPMFMAVAERPA